MDISIYLTPQTEKYIEGYDLLKSFLSEAKKHHANDEISEIHLDNDRCTLKLWQIPEYYIESPELGFGVSYPAGYVELLFEGVSKLEPNNKSNIPSMSYHSTLLIDTIKDCQGKDCGVTLRYIHDYSGDNLFVVESKSARLISFKREGYIE